MNSVAFTSRKRMKPVEDDDETRDKGTEGRRDEAESGDRSRADAGASRSCEGGAMSFRTTDARGAPSPASGWKSASDAGVMRGCSATVLKSVVSSQLSVVSGQLPVPFVPS